MKEQFAYLRQSYLNNKDGVKTSGKTLIYTLPLKDWLMLWTKFLCFTQISYVETLPPNEILLKHLGSN